MDTRKLVGPALLLFGGAVIGRMIGVKPLIRAGLAAASVAGVTSKGMLDAFFAPSPPARRAPVHRAQRKRTAAKRSAKVAH